MARKPEAGTGGRGEEGAALIIVLMLIATLAFIVLGLSRQTALAAQRGFNAAAKQELFWRAIGAEALAAAAIRTAVSADGGPAFTPEHPLFATDHELTLDEGRGVVRFADLSACFNVNALGAASGEEEFSQDGDLTPAGAGAEFAALLDALGVGRSDAQNIVAAVTDWIDEDRSSQTGGAEDSFYGSLPVPYRTGGAPMADLTEMRAVAGVTADLYDLLRTQLCAAPDETPAIINLNALTPDDAPLLVGLAGGDMTIGQAVSIIGDRPPGGYTDEASFWTRVTQASDVDPETFQNRGALTPSLIGARATLTLGEASLNVSMVFTVDNQGDSRLVAREFGAFQ